MKKHLRPTVSLLSGSYGRNTAIRPLHDIDLFLVLPGESNPPRHEPSHYLGLVYQALRQAGSVTVGLIALMDLLCYPWKSGGALNPCNRPRVEACCPAGA